MIVMKSLGENFFVVKDFDRETYKHTDKFLLVEILDKAYVRTRALDTIAECEGVVGFWKKIVRK